VDTASLSSGVGTVTIMFFLSTNFYNFYFGSCKALLLVPLRPFEERKRSFLSSTDAGGTPLSPNTRFFP